MAGERRSLLTSLGSCLWLVSLLGSLALVQAADAQPASLDGRASPAVRDDRGVEVRLARPARRIVSLLPSLTETVCALGACSSLVGTDRHSNYPPQVRALPKLGGLDDANVEAIVALKPDLVLLAMSSRIVERLEGLGITVAALEPRSSNDVLSALERTDRLLGSSAAPSVWRNIQAKIEQASRQLDPAARGLSVYYEVGSGPYAASETSFVGEALIRLGLHNIVPGRLGPYPQINPEFVVAADPALILIASEQATGLASRPGWQHVRALRENRLCRIDSADGDVLARAGPRMGDAALVLSRCVNQALAVSPLPRSSASLSR